MLAKLILFFKSIWNRKTLKAASALTGKSVATNDLSPELMIGVKLNKRLPFMVDEYQKLVRHTGGMVSKSMAIAYEKALRDVLEFLVPGSKRGSNTQRGQ